MGETKLSAPGAPAATPLPHKHTAQQPAAATLAGTALGLSGDTFCALGLSTHTAYPIGTAGGRAVPGQGGEGGGGEGCKQNSGPQGGRYGVPRTPGAPQLQALKG